MEDCHTCLVVKHSQMIREIIGPVDGDSRNAVKITTNKHFLKSHAFGLKYLRRNETICNALR